MVFRHRQYKAFDKAIILARRMAKLGLFCQVWFDPYVNLFKIDIWERGNLVPQKALRPFLMAYNPNQGRFVWYAVNSYGLP